MTRFKLKRTQPALAAPEPEWIGSLRDFGLMIAGIYQDLRGDAHEALRHFGLWLRDEWRKRFGPREG